MLSCTVLPSTVLLPLFTTLIPWRLLETTCEPVMVASAASTTIPSISFAEIVDSPPTVSLPPFTVCIPFSVFAVTLDPVTVPVAASIINPSVPFSVTEVPLVRETLASPVT